MFAYQIGRPFWKIAARMGLPLQVVVCVHRDDEAGVFFAHSPSLRGLVVEAKTLDQLAREVDLAVQTLLEDAMAGGVATPLHPRTTLQLDGAFCAA